MAIAVALPSHFVTVAIGNLDPIPNAGGTECDPGEGEVDKCMRVSHLRSATPTESPSIRRIPLTPASRAARRPQFHKLLEVAMQTTPRAQFAWGLLPLKTRSQDIKDAI